MTLIGLDKTGQGMVAEMIQKGKELADHNKKVKILADILANSMEHFGDVIDFKMNLKSNEIPVLNYTYLWLNYWRLDALKRDDPSFDWINWIKENKFVTSK